MISEEYQFLFIHIPKTAGNSVGQQLQAYSEDRLVTLAAHQDGVERFEVRHPRYPITKHSTLTDYKALLAPALFRRLFKFATLRNPWERMISFYFSPHRGVTQWDPGAFRALVERTPPARHYLLTDASGPMDKPLDADIDCLLRFETLEQDFQRVSTRLGLPWRGLPRYNASQRNHYTHYYDDELIAVVEDRFGEEIAFGDYRFGG